MNSVSSGDLVRINDVGYTWRMMMAMPAGIADRWVRQQQTGETVVTDVQVFTGTTTLWAKPTRAVSVTVICVGGGGGGGVVGLPVCPGGSGGGRGMSGNDLQRCQPGCQCTGLCICRWNRRSCRKFRRQKDSGKWHQILFGDYLKASGGNSGEQGAPRLEQPEVRWSGLKSQGRLWCQC